MMCTKRTIAALTFLSLLLPGLGGAEQSRTSAAAADSTKTSTISGSAGLAGVVIKGLPGDPVTDNNGCYAAQVSQGWTGFATPTKPGYVFEPSTRRYTGVANNLSNQDYAARIVTFTIAGNVGVAGALMQGLPGNPVTGNDGAYKAEVPYGWSGRVVPRKEGLSFTPLSREYWSMTAPCGGQDYVAKLVMVTISDRLLASNEPVGEAKVIAEPGNYSAMTDYRGRYRIGVPYGWSGRLAVEMGDGRREIGSFTNVTNDILDGRPASSSEQQPALPRPKASAYPRTVLPVPAGNVFVIPTTQVAPQKLTETADDLRVMLQIFREKLSEPRLVRGTFVDFGDFFSDRDRALEAFYLQGSAAVFVLEMDAPFSFAPPQTSEGPATQENVDTVWQRARQKLYAPEAPMTRGHTGLSGETERMDFQQFKEDLIKTFRHAANLRNVEPNEAVILMIKAHDDSAGWPGAPVSGGGSYSNRGGLWFEGGSYSSSSGTFGPSGGTSQADSRSYSRGSATSQDRAGRPPSGAAPAGPGAVLTIQAKKADIDAFAKGSLGFEQFQQRVNVFTY